MGIASYRQFSRIGLFCAWVFAVSSVLASLWVRRIIVFPSMSQPVAERLVGIYGATDGEQVADLELLLGFAIFLPLVAALTAIVLCLKRAICKNR